MLNIVFCHSGVGTGWASAFWFCKKRQVCTQRGLGSEMAKLTMHISAGGLQVAYPNWASKHSNPPSHSSCGTASGNGLKNSYLLWNSGQVKPNRQNKIPLLCAVPAKEKVRKREAREMAKRRHVYLHVFANSSVSGNRHWLSQKSDSDVDFKCCEIYICTKWHSAG